MESRGYAPAESAKSTALPQTTRLGPVELTVPSLDRAISFYEKSIGLVLRRRTGRRATMGVADSALLILVEDENALPAERSAGLYHFALRFPSRAELARAVKRLARAGTQIQGASDHGASEAIYLADPFGTGVELAADRPRSEWPESIFLRAPLDFDSLLASDGGEAPSERAKDGLAVGHVHLHVGELQAPLHFYRDLLGFDLKVALPSAMFLAAGDYHHHVAVNTWRGDGIPPAPPHSIGLRHFTVVVPDERALRAIDERLGAGGLSVEHRSEGLLTCDPAGNGVLITLGGR